MMDSLMQTLARLAQQAGAIIQSCHGDGECADEKADKFWRTSLQKHFPKDMIITEESFSPEQLHNVEGRVWVVDPLDGTSTYKNGGNSYTTMLALVDRQCLAAGLVHQPYTRDTYTAVRGRGAFKNNVPINVSSRERLEDLRLVHRHTMSNHLPEIIAALPCSEKAISGSLGLKLSLIASGRFDFTVYDTEPNLWDILPGKIIVEEAGGKVTDLHGKDIPPFSRKARGLLASNGSTHQKLLGVIQPLSLMRQTGKDI